ncbi:MAG: glycosyltransferase [Planctomycetes bacterium]|nr:glycosyltransferase [Planctomycetota bacterium]
MAEPVLSIVTPCLNQARWVRACLESVSSQEVADGTIEHIIMDGGSTDGSAEIIAEHARAHPALVAHWESAPDAGQSDAINRGLAKARGTFATWLNADDWYEPGALAAVLSEIERRPGADVLVGRCRFVDLEGATVWDPRPPEPMSAANLLRLRSQWFNGRLICQPEAFFRLSKFRELGGLNVQNHYSMDHELWVELALSGARFEAFDRPIACLRVHEGQKSADNRAVVRSMLDVSFCVLDEHGGMLGDEAEQVRAELEAMREKLRVADAFIARWDLVRSGERVKPDAGEGRIPARGCTTARAELRELGEPHARAALRLARRTAGGHVRVLARSMDPAALEADLGRVFRRVEMVSTEYDRAVDVAVVDDVLVREADPAGVIAAMWDALRPGGVLVVLGAVVPAAGLMAYLDSLQKHLSNHLSTNTELRLHPEADAYLECVAAEAGGLSSSDAARVWLTAHPSCRGAAVESIVNSLQPRAEALMSRRWGSYWFHPLAPFPFVPGEGVRQEDTRLTGVWGKT